MAEKRPASDNSPETRLVHMTPHSSSSDPPPPGPIELQPLSLSRAPSLSSLSSVTVPVRLDVLYFLINSAAKGAQYGLPPAPVHGGQGSNPTCHGPVTQHPVSCCSCRFACPVEPGSTTAQQPSESHHGGLSTGISHSQSNKRHWIDTPQQNNGRSWSAANQPNMARVWRTAQSSTGWRENQRGEAKRSEGDNWQGRRQNFGRSWGDWRQGGADSSDSWRSGSQDWRRGRGGSPLGSMSSNGKRIQEGCPWPASGDGPDAKRLADSTRVGWQKSQGVKESPCILGKTGNAGPAKLAGRENGEDWETDYESMRAPMALGSACHSFPHQNSQAGPSKVGKNGPGESAPPADPRRPKLATSPVPESSSKDRGAAPTIAASQPSASSPKESKNGEFVSFLKSLYSDTPRKSCSEDSTDLVIDTDVESSKAEEEEEEQASKTAAGGEMKSLE